MLSCTRTMRDRIAAWQRTQQPTNVHTERIVCTCWAHCCLPDRWMKCSHCFSLSAVLLPTSVFVVQQYYFAVQELVCCLNVCTHNRITRSLVSTDRPCPFLFCAKHRSIYQPSQETGKTGQGRGKLSSCAFTDTSFSFGYRVL